MFQNNIHFLRADDLNLVDFSGRTPLNFFISLLQRLLNRDQNNIFFGAIFHAIFVCFLISSCYMIIYLIFGRFQSFCGWHEVAFFYLAAFI